MAQLCVPDCPIGKKAAFPHVLYGSWTSSIMLTELHLKEPWSEGLRPLRGWDLSPWLPLVTSPAPSSPSGVGHTGVYLGDIAQELLAE